jgi:ribokinase
MSFTMLPRITVVGSANIDLTFRAARLPRPGETVFGTDYLQGFGGKGANQAVAAARLGANVAFVGSVGDDEFGRSIREQLIGEGIDVTHLTTDSGKPTGTAAIFVDDSGENMIVGVPGANLGLTPELVRQASDLLRSSAIVLAPCEIMMETLVETFRIAYGQGPMSILNPAPARELPDELLRSIDLFIPNETELRQLTGTSCESLEDIARAAEILGRPGKAEVLVTLGARGAMHVRASGVKHILAVSVTPLDTSGAGDAFCGAIAAYLAQGHSIAVSAEKANRAAAISVTRLGTQRSFPTRQEVEC